VPDSGQDYWTILLLHLPELGDKEGDQWSVTEKGFGYCSLQRNMAMLIYRPMVKAVDGLKSLSRRIERLLGIGDAIFYPENHNRLTHDDDLLSRSRLYFWVINCILESDNLIRASIKAWKEYRNDILIPYGERMNLNRKRGVEGDLYKYIERWDTRCEELESIQNLLKEQREKSMALRDGVWISRIKFKLAY
jgi:hypothetical protein